MKKALFLLVFSIISLHNTLSQTTDCITPKATCSQNVNQNPMIVTNASDNYPAETVFTEQFSFFPKSCRKLFASTGLWIAGYNAKQEIVGATATHRPQGFSFNFYSGILNKDGNLELAKEFDKIWFVTRRDIEKHLADYADNKKIDEPLNSIYAWAGKGNPFFKAYNKFDLPNAEFAPFVDTNNDGVYDPSKGDFPLPEGINKNNIPEIMTWATYCDYNVNCPRRQSEMPSIKVEVHQTTWAFNCSNSNVLDKTNFASYKLQFKGNETIDSTFLGLWADTDLGCYEDDYVGCSPSQNASFCYNRDEIDGNVSSTGETICGTKDLPWDKGDMPVGSVKLLNQKLDGFMYYNDRSANTPLSATTDPAQAKEYYQYLNNTWLNGTPLTGEGFGYNTDPSLTPDKYAFPGNPNDSTQLSMRIADKDGLYRSDIRTLNIVKLGKVKPNQVVKLDVAFGMHRKKDNTVSQNLDLMYKELDTIQNFYNQGFNNPCTPFKYCQGIDCVYPGEVNQDGIVNYKDIVYIAGQRNSKGKERTDPLIFAPLNAENWTKSYSNGINAKHADADGNGIVNSTDRGLVNLYYDYKTPNYQQKPDVYAPSGDDISFRLLNNKVVVDSTKLKKDISYTLELALNVPNMFSYGFQLEIDSNYFKFDSLLLNKAPIISYTSLGSLKYIKDKNFFVIEMAQCRWTTTNKVGKNLLLNIIGRQLKPIYPSQCTKIRIKNMVAFTAGGAPMDLKVKDFEFCFTDITTSDKDVVLPNPVQVSPNPFDNELLVKNSALETIDIELIGLLGQVIQQQKVNAESSISLDTAQLPNGVYFLKCHNKQQQWTTKVVKN